MNRQKKYWKCGICKRIKCPLDLKQQFNRKHPCPAYIFSLRKERYYLTKDEYEDTIKRILEHDNL